MAPPFPGMDPWLEGHVWPDVHHGLAFVFKEQLVSQVVPKYFVRIETYIAKDTHPEEDVGIMYPDVEILRKEKKRIDIASEPTATYRMTTPPTLAIPIATPIEVRIPVIEIRDREKQQLITAIEILSPVNKRKPGLEDYRKKRETLHNNGVNLLEVDLLRRGERPFNYPNLPKWAHYFIMLTRGNTLHTDVWAMSIRDQLPVVPIPLKSPDPDAQLDIGTALQELYSRSRYDLSVNYDTTPAPPAFPDDDKRWLKGILKEKQLIS